MKSLAVAALLLLSGAARAERTALGPSGFTYDRPSEQEALSRRTDVDNPSSGGRAFGTDFTTTNWGAGNPWYNMVRISYSENWDDHATGLSYASSGKGTANFPPVQTKKRGRYVIHEAGWRKKGAALTEISIAYVVELAPRRYIIVQLDCSEEALPEYSALYRRLRDSLAPAAQ